MEGLDLVARELSTFRAGLDSLFLCAGTDLTLLAVSRHCFNGSLAASALAARVHPAGPAVQSAVGSQVCFIVFGYYKACQGEGAASAHGSVNKCAAIHVFGFHAIPCISIKMLTNTWCETPRCDSEAQINWDYFLTL